MTCDDSQGIEHGQHKFRKMLDTCLPPEEGLGPYTLGLTRSSGGAVWPAEASAGGHRYEELPIAAALDAAAPAGAMAASAIVPVREPAGRGQEVLAARRVPVAR
jgi:hypothetical protein